MTLWKLFLKLKTSLKKNEMAFQLSGSAGNPPKWECLNYGEVAVTLLTEIACESCVIYICSL